MAAGNSLESNKLENKEIDDSDEEQLPPPPTILRQPIQYSNKQNSVNIF